MDYQTFMNTYRSYVGLSDRIIEIKDRISLLEYDMTGVKGVSFDRIPSARNQTASEMRMLEMIEQKAKLERELRLTEIATANVKQIIDKEFERMPKMVMEVICRNTAGESLEVLAEEYGYTKSGLWRLIKRTIEK